MSNPKVSPDLVELVVNGTPPGTPRRPLVSAGRPFWEFPQSSAER
jgi:hypothetical protein